MWRQQSRQQRLILLLSLLFLLILMAINQQNIFNIIETFKATGESCSFEDIKEINVQSKTWRMFPSEISSSSSSSSSSRNLIFFHLLPLMAFLSPRLSDANTTFSAITSAQWCQYHFLCYHLSSVLPMLPSNTSEITTLWRPPGHFYFLFTSD